MRDILDVNESINSFKVGESRRVVHLKIETQGLREEFEINDVQHLPLDADWEQLEARLATVATCKLSEARGVSTSRTDLFMSICAPTA